MLVQLADWCYRQRRLVVVLWIAALVAAFALAGAFGGEYQAGLPPTRLGVPGGLGDAEGQVPAEGGRHRADRSPLRGRPLRGRGQRAGRGDLRRRRDATQWWASPARSSKVARPRSRRTARPPTPTSPSTRRSTSTHRRRPRHSSNPSSPPVTTPCRSRSAARSRRCRRRLPWVGEGIGLIAAAIILLLTFGSAVAMGLPLITALFGLGMAMALGEVLRRVVDVPDWAAADRGDGRHRRRHRLRAAHRHPVPQQPRRRTGPTPRDADRDRDRRPRRRLRRPHRRRLDAGHPPGGPAGDERVRLHRVAGRAGHHGRVADAAAGAAGLRRSQHRTTARAVREPRSSTPTTPPAGTAGADSSSAGRGSPRSVRLGVLLALAAPFLGIRFGFPDAAERPADLHHPTGVRPARRRVRPRLLGTHGAHRPRGVRQRAACLAERGGPAARRGQRRGLRRPGRRERRRGHRGADRGPHHLSPGRSHRGAGRHAARRRDPGRHRRHRPHRRRRWDGRRRTSTPRAGSRTGCRSSSAACCWCPSCC